MGWPQGTNQLQVSGEGLRAEGGWCESLAARLADNSPPQAGPVWSGLGSAAAINTARAEVAAANVRCTSRVQATGAELAAAAANYTENEASSAALLRALDTPTVR